ncbi:helicase-related protein [Leucobacter salsicius]|uniref:helicase-related protein n=1 Tax=Leucobacter salsicius TaxID=664638 RepID=UPI0003481B27|nr:helicase-related protein [Leucobacter salsicius]
MSAVDRDAVLQGLRSFQQDAVAHVTNQFYGPESAAHSGRFLIADETGLGKSVIARGIVAETIRALESDDSVKRIDIVYICSNRDLAGQNLKRLNVTGQTEVAMATRLSLLALESSRLSTPSTSSSGKPINLVSFTPGTSFSVASSHQGSGDERALLVLLLDDLLQHDGAQQHATRVMFQGRVESVERFARGYVERIAAGMNGRIDATIRDGFENIAREQGSLTTFVRLRDRISGHVARNNIMGAESSQQDLPEELRQEIVALIAKLRTHLALASVESLEPDLVILDEFQRFKSLLDPEKGGDAAELADGLFRYRGVKVLLLSATPYEPFTQATENDANHYEDFLAIVKFLCNDDQARIQEVQHALQQYRETLVSGSSALAAAASVRRSLNTMMSRSERPNTMNGQDLVEVQRLEVPVPTGSDLSRWVALAELGNEVGSPVNLEYWKSVPHFANFMEHYKIARAIDEAAGGRRAKHLERKLRSTHAITRDQVERRAMIDVGGGPLRALMDQTLDAGWWKLLWLPPSMPYLKPGPTYAPFSDGRVTKQVLFSAWSAAPTSIASIVSHEAERRMRGISDEGLPASDRTAPTQRFTYRQTDDQAASLSTLAIFWPHPELLSVADQLSAVRANGGLIESSALVEQIASRLPQGETTERAWEAFFGHSGAFDPERTDSTFAIDRDEAGGRATRGDQNAVPEPGSTSRGIAGLRANLLKAQDHARSVGSERSGTEPKYLSHPDLARIVAFSPGSLAYRSLSSLANGDCTPRGVWRAAFTIAEGLRALFNRPEAQELLDTLYSDAGSRMPYWRRVLDYCADGNLRAVLDEYLFQLWCETGQQPVTDEMLGTMALNVATSLGLRPATYHAREATLERDVISMNARFAVRYGGGDQSRSEGDADVARQSAVRAAFNSPFAPFVLASTSVGQEGIDFHWWSHSVIHWNLPSNPVDFEQREGRVNRYGGHAVRKNVASQHWEDVLVSTDRCAWRAAFDAATLTDNEAGEFSPWWMYPGPAQIQRTLVQYPLSRDLERYEKLRSALTLYRLTLGQPRQEDMVEMLEKRGVDGAEAATIDLRPPERNR